MQKDEDCSTHALLPTPLSPSPSLCSPLHPLITLPPDAWGMQKERGVICGPSDAECMSNTIVVPFPMLVHSDTHLSHNCSQPVADGMVAVPLPLIPTLELVAFPGPGSNGSLSARSRFIAPTPTPIIVSRGPDSSMSGSLSGGRVNCCN
jgi:hypothetical protein